MASNNKDVLLLRTTSNDKNNSGGTGEAYYGYHSSPNNNKVTTSKSPSSPSQPQITNTDCEAAVEETKTPTHNKQSGLDELLQRAAIAATVSYDDNGTAVPSNIYIDTDSNESEILGKEEATFYSARENEYGDDNLWGLLSGVGGNIYEWYDFAVYGLLASEIGSNFFPKSSKELQLINSFGVYLAAFLMRPIGAILFGEIGDRTLGRKNALVISIVLITLPSVAMGLLPTYEQLGALSPVLLVILRMMQGLSVGGQLAGSYVLSIEQSTSATRGFRGSICDASSVGGFLLATAVTAIVRQYLPEEEVEDWGWRIPFWFSLLIAPALYLIVRETEESKFWEERKEQQNTEKVIRELEHVESTPAVYDLMGSKFRRKQLFGMIGVLCTMTSSFYMLFLWAPIYLGSLRGILTEKEADVYTFFVVLIYIFFLLIAGRLSDQFPHRSDLIQIGLFSVIFSCPNMFAMFESESKVGVFLGQIQYGFCLSLVQGGLAAWEVELWMADPTLSFTGVAMGHNIAATIFGGTMPLIATSLFYKADSLAYGDYSTSDLMYRMIPGFYISILALLSLYCLNKVVRHPHDVRTGELQLRKARKIEKKRKKEANVIVISPSSTFGTVHSDVNAYVPPKS